MSSTVDRHLMSPTETPSDSDHKKKKKKKEEDPERKRKKKEKKKKKVGAYDCSTVSFPVPERWSPWPQFTPEIKNPAQFAVFSYTALIKSKAVS